MVEIIDKVVDKAKNAKDKVVDTTKDVIDATKDSMSSSPSLSQSSFSQSQEKNHKDSDQGTETKRIQVPLNAHIKEESLAPEDVKIDATPTTNTAAVATPTTNTAAVATPAKFSKYTYETNTNNNNNNQNSNDLSESLNRSLDETKDNINRSIDESRNQIPRYNNIVSSYQEQSLQTAKEISEQYIESQKAVINSLQSAWKPYSESYTRLINSFASPDSMTQAYAKFVSNLADNAVSAIRLTNNMIFSNLDSMKSTLQQARDNSKHLSNINVNAARTFEQNSRRIAEAAKEANSSNNQSNQSSQDNKSSSSSNNQTTYHNTTTATAKKQ